MFGAGSDTTASAISISIMAAACYPDAQAKVQEELDSVIGKERGEFRGVFFFFFLGGGFNYHHHLNFFFFSSTYYC